MCDLHVYVCFAVGAFGVKEHPAQPVDPHLPSSFYLPEVSHLRKLGEKDGTVAYRPVVIIRIFIDHQYYFDIELLFVNVLHIMYCNVVQGVQYTVFEFECYLVLVPSTDAV